MQTHLTLDVGCGYEPHGDVHVDLYPKKNMHRDRDIDVCRMSNFVKADCHFLPFRSRAFKTVFCKHVLEHKGVRLVEACKEMLRVSSSKLILIVPNLFRYSKHESYHDKIFQPSDFHKLFKQFQHKIKQQGYDWTKLYVPKGARLVRGKHSPFKFVFCPIPTELKIEVKKIELVPL